jgi:stage II sporulation protein AA (anti-sigma F factor antagonist)
MANRLTVVNITISSRHKPLFSSTIIAVSCFLDIKFTNRGLTLIASFSGELDHHFAEYARNKIEGELLKATTRNVVFDFSGLSFMDSSGIGVIVGRYANIIKLGGKVAIICKNPKICRILEMSGILKLIPVFESLDYALNALRSA